MLTIRYQKSFKKDFKRVVSRGYDIRLLGNVIFILAEQKPLPDACKGHVLVGNYAGFRECHITGDRLLIYRIWDGELTLCLTRTGTHSDLF